MLQGSEEDEQLPGAPSAIDQLRQSITGVRESIDDSQMDSMWASQSTLDRLQSSLEAATKPEVVHYLQSMIPTGNKTSCVMIRYWRSPCQSLQKAWEQYPAPHDPSTCHAESHSTSRASGRTAILTFYDNGAEKLCNVNIGGWFFLYDA